MSNVIPLPKRPGRHAAHRADRYAHPAYRLHHVYRYVDGVGTRVDDYRPKHRQTDPNLG